MLKRALLPSQSSTKQGLLKHPVAAATGSDGIIVRCWHPHRWPGGHCNSTVCVSVLGGRGGGMVPSICIMMICRL